MAEIRSKADFYRLYARGLIGNMLRNWTHDEWARFTDAQSFPVPVIAARCTSIAGAPMRYDLAADCAIEWVQDTCLPLGISTNSYRFAELAPDHINTLQGEVLRTEQYVSLQYVLNGHQRMREALVSDKVKHANGLQAVNLMRRYMDAKGWETLQYIWDTWPDAIVEFCCYPHSLGVFKSNTLFWEARTHY